MIKSQFNKNYSLIFNFFNFETKNKIMRSLPLIFLLSFLFSIKSDCGTNYTMCEIAE